MTARVIAPLVTAYALFIWILASWWRHPSRPAPRPGRPPLRYLLTLVGGGYAVFLVIVLVFHVWIAGQRGAMRSALTGGAFLAFGDVLPVFLLLSLIDARLSR
jgi:hypothetical protein